MGVIDDFLDALFLKTKKPAQPSNVSRPHSPNSTVKQETKGHSVPTQETTESRKVPPKVTDKIELERNLKVETQCQEITMTFYCPMRNAKIYCHSDLVDKLGDLTKFIISSIYKEHSVEEIRALTQMGNTTVNEELDYLIHGGLINNDRQTLTELGKQYGVLLEKFSELSEGIDISYNVFTDKFESIEENKLVSNPDQRYILGGPFIPALTRDDNHSNSLEIAKDQIEMGMPFCQEIRNSLYTTVKIERTESKYRSVYVKDFNGGSSTKCGPCVRIAIPCDATIYKPRYKWIDEYRDSIQHITDINIKHDDLLSDKAKLLINVIKEENDAEAIEVNINTITGQIIQSKTELCEKPSETPVYVLDRQPIQLILDEDVCNGIYLHEINREHLYLIRYFSYSEMEV